MEQIQNWYSNEGLHKMLMASVADGHLCHAYLFYGSAGVGKKTIALDFARAILCRGAEPPCGECNSCRKVRSGNHPDLWRYDGKSGANSIHIDVIRQLRQDAYIKPNDGNYKVYILPRAEDMTIGAANAFLKVLEEPPAHAVFLLTADKRELVPETVRSRCIMLELFPLTVGDTLDALKQHFPDREEQELFKAANLSAGNPGHAVAFLTSEEFADIGALSDRAAAGIQRGSEYELLAALNGGVSSKERMRLLLERLSALLRNVLLQKLSPKPGAEETIAALAVKLTANHIAAAVELLEQAQSSIDKNANLSLLANMLSANLMRAFYG